MKKLILIAAIASIWLTAILPLNVSAADITVGAATWYTWWDFKDENGRKADIDPAFLYGPALSVKFSDDYNLTFVFLYGNFEMNQEQNTEEVTRMDSDLALNYRLNSYFKIFAGAKYMGYTTSDMDHAGYGPGAGISAVLPLGNDFFILANISGLYLWGEHEESGDPELKINYNEYGANASLSLAYYIAAASTTISFGGRYQYFKTDYEETASSSSSGSDIDHHFYGVTLSATYTFSI